MSSPAPTLLWFEEDLRLSDNAALRAAVARNAPLIPLFVLPPPGAGAHPGSAARWWLHHSLSRLDAQLRQLGSQLILYRGDPLKLIPLLTHQWGVGAIYWNRRYTPHQQQRDCAVEAALHQQGREVGHFPGALLHEPWSLANASGTPYRVFTPFWRSAMHTLDLVSAPLATPPQLPPCPSQIDSFTLDELQLLPTIRWDSGLAATWQCGEAAAQRRLVHFAAELLPHYPGLRDLPGREGTSRLSPHLRFGEITPRQILWQIRAAAEQVRDGSAGDAYLRQLYWREFAYHQLHHFPETVERPLDRRFERFPWRDDTDALQHWQRGTTGIPLIDAGMRELWYSGWMHNRVRMVVASLLTKNLRLPWQTGAAWFMETLVDADLANNTLGWQWVAGCGADAAPYFRIFNPVSQSEKFDAGGTYLRRWLPELAELPDRWLHQPWLAPTPPRDYPAPLLDLAQSRRAALDAWERVKTAPR